MKISKISKKTVVITAFACLLGISAGQLIKSGMEKRESARLHEEAREHIQIRETRERTTVEPITELLPDAPIEVDIHSLKEINGDVLGWIYIPDTDISYPLMYGEDNDYYMNHTYNGEYNAGGSIFVDCRNASDFSDNRTIIYGHNMLDKSMFGALGEFAKQEYYEAHPVFYIILEDGFLECEIFSAHEAGTKSLAFQTRHDDPKEHEKYLEYVRGESEIKSDVKVDKNDRIIMLSTCTATGAEDKRFVVHAKTALDTRR